MFLLFIRLFLVWQVIRRRNEKDYNCGGAVISGTWLLGEMGLQYPQEVAPYTLHMVCLTGWRWLKNIYENSCNTRLF